MATLLTITQAIAGELGLTVPTAVYASTVPETVQMLALLNREGRELQQEHDWTALQTEFVVNVNAPVSTTGNITSGSAVITSIPSTASITAGTFVCTGSGIPVAARVLSVDSATQVTLTMQATATTTGVTLVFSKDTYAPPSDFDRFINATHWDRTNRWQLLGPDSPQMDQWHRSGIVTSGPRRHYRQIGQSPNYRLWPPGGASDAASIIAFEYISKNWAATAAGVGVSAWSGDTDIPLLDENLFILGGKWRFLQAKGLEYAPHQREYLDYVDRRKAMDGGAPTLSLSSNRSGLYNALIPDGSWSGPTGANES